MSQKAPAQPPPPDPVATARAQAEFNSASAQENAALNRVNQSTPQGSSTWRQRPTEGWNEAAYLAANPDVAGSGMSGLHHYQRFGVNEARTGVDPNFQAGGWENTVQYSPEQQRLYDLSTAAQTTYGEAANAQLGQVRDRLSTPFAFDGPALQSRADFTGIGDPNQSRDAVQAALLARINPDLERERAALENRLANQGITMGSQAWNTGMMDYGRQANDARYGAILNAGQEQSRMFGLGMGQAQMGNAARQQSLAEQLALRSQPVNEAAALLSGQQVQNPQFNAVPQVMVQAPDYQAAVGQNYAGQMAGWQANTQRIGAENAAYANAIGQLGGAAAMKFSDRRLKRDVSRIGTGAHGLPVYRFTYVWGEPGEGYMADEVAAVAPHAVHIGEDGFACVDYSAV